MNSLEISFSDAFARQDNDEIIRLLRAAPSLAGLTNDLNQDALWLAASYGMLDVVQELFAPEYVEYVDIFRFDIKKRDAFEIAKIFHQKEVMDFLGPIYGVEGYAADEEAIGFEHSWLDQMQLAMSAVGQQLSRTIGQVLSAQEHLASHLNVVGIRRWWLGMGPAVTNRAMAQRLKRRRQFFVAGSAVVVLLVGVSVGYSLFGGFNVENDDNQLIAANDNVEFQVAAASALSSVSGPPPFGVSDQPEIVLMFTEPSGHEWTLRMKQEFMRNESSDPTGHRTDLDCAISFVRDDGKELQSSIRVLDVFSAQREFQISERIIPEELEKRREAIKQSIINYCLIID